VKVVHISAECYPIAKVGGLADVVGALPKYQSQLGLSSAVVMPFYKTAFREENEFQLESNGEFYFDGKTVPYRIMSTKEKEFGFDLYLLDIPGYLDTEYVYSMDDTRRFLAFQIATLIWMRDSNIEPDVIHCHDHHTGLIPFFMSHAYEFEIFRHTPSILTIHSAAYQGWFSHDLRYLLPAFDEKDAGLLDWNGSINPLATAVKCAWKVTTVSPSYLEELKTDAKGIENLIQWESEKCSGVLNGIDTKLWDPSTDNFLMHHYSKTNPDKGKRANKLDLCYDFMIDQSLPLVVFIGRLVWEKGADLLPSLVRMASSDPKFSLLILGSGSDHLGDELHALKINNQNWYNCYIGYDEKLSHRLYAGADFLLMPSRVEPCGLNQMYAMRYGTIPVTSKVGGLRDTVRPIADGGEGFQVNNHGPDSILKGLLEAARFYKDSTVFKAKRKEIMEIDHSWERSADEYLKIYKSTQK
jgi:starch synthase